MPVQPPVRNATNRIPTWADPALASVFDVPGQGLLRKVVGLLGLDDPQQVMALGVPLEVGPMGGGLVDAVAAKLPRFAKAIKAFHGSPHDFAPEAGAPLGKFKSAAIGTGEGAQAYGHGLYFAENEAVATGYKNQLGYRRFNVGDREIFPSAAGTTKTLEQSKAHSIAADALDDAYNAQSSSPAQYAANKLRKAKKYYPEDAAEIDEAMWTIADWQGAGEKSTSGGHVYEVGIDAHPDHLLDYDKPIAEQTEAVKTALRKAGLYAETTGSPTHPVEKTGRHLVTGLSMAPDGELNAAAASETLRAAGIPGIKYLDGGSRGAGAGSRNFVIFDDATIDILKKYGIAAGVGTGAAGAGAAGPEGAR